jgi:uncharacterized protein (TIGR01777 family)
MQEKYLVTGGTGFIGKQLCLLLAEQGNEVNVLSTRKDPGPSAHPNIRYVYWDPSKLYIDPDFTLEEGKVINLAGAGVANKRWTKERKEEIRQSRIAGLKTLWEAIDYEQINTTHLLSASAIGFYGNHAGLCDEDTKGDSSFLSSVCNDWEYHAWRLSSFNITIAVARIGIVLGTGGGALKELLKPLRYGLAAIPGNGKQMYSWIHEKDLCNVLLFLSSNSIRGAFNTTAPHPVNMDTLFNAMLLHKPAYLKMHVPEWLLKLVLGEMSIEVTKSTNVSCKKLLDHGFEFKYPTIDDCMKDLLGGNGDDMYKGLNQ